MVNFAIMNQISRPPVSTTLKPRILAAVLGCTVAAITLVALVALRRDFVIEVGAVAWATVTVIIGALTLWALDRTIRPLPLIRATSEGIWFCRLLRAPLPWPQIARIEATTERGFLGDAHDHLIVFFKHPQVLPWRGARSRRHGTSVPQAAMTVTMGLAWPMRAREVRAFLRDAARQVALPVSTSTTPSNATGQKRLLVNACALSVAIFIPVAAHLADIGLPRLFAKGIAYYDAGHIAQAIPHLERDARAGDGESARLLGEIFLNGDSGTRNLSLSTAWFQRGAERGDAWSAYRLGDAYRHGLGIQQSTDNAITWLNAAADADIAQAAFALGDIYRIGDGVIRDYDTAIRYLKDAARLGFAAAEHDLGRLYHDGLALPRDDVEAHAWYSKAAARGHTPAKYDLARLLLSGEPTTRENGLITLTEAADDGYAPAQRLLALHFLQGDGVPVDLIAAYQYMALAARQWPVANRADVIRQRAEIGARLNPAALEDAKNRIRAWRPNQR